MYAIHTTPGFIIESRPRGEAGKLLYIFTRDLGLVVASAQGIRLEKSKLRYHSQEFSLGEFSFVRGKEFWKMTGASQVQVRQSTVEKSRNDLNVIHRVGLRQMIPRIALLLRRLLRGEEGHPELFDHIQASLSFIVECDNHSLSSSGVPSAFSEDQMRTLESLIVFRIVHLLGYVGHDKELDAQVISAPLSIRLLDSSAEQRVVMNKHINKALKESQL